jgi:hypothetical protein
LGPGLPFVAFLAVATAMASSLKTARNPVACAEYSQRS